jgi:nitrous oxidase accessory protein
MRTPCTICLLLVAACGREPAAAAPPPALLAAGEPVAPGEPLQARVDAAADGAVLTLLPGRHRGPVRIARGVTLQGTRDAVVVSDGTGTTVRLAGDHSVLRGITVEGSGDRADLSDGAVLVAGTGITVEDVLVRGALFGILAQQSSHIAIRRNVVVGSGQPALGLRGDGIRLWETTDSVVENNVVRDCRDLVVWYSSRNRVVGNAVTGCRYGTHFMYSHDSVVADNRYVDDVVGLFVMYSHGVQVQRNLLARAGGAAGIGLGVKESGDLVVEDNWFVQDTDGVYLDTTPFANEQHNRFARNVVRLCDTALHFHASLQRNEFTDNVFADNGALIAVGGGGDALGCDFHGNWFDTYRGYDLDGDGSGDVPFEFRRLSSQLTSRYPDLALLQGAPALQAVDLIGELLPLFAPRLLLRDQAPRLHEPEGIRPPEVDHAR